MSARELDGLAFRCLEDCGFCCTFVPEVEAADKARLVAAGHRLKVSVGHGRTYLQLQGGCGACTFLQRRACSVYGERPAHCRYFPFHVYFGPEPDVNVNYSCRGVERRREATLLTEYKASVLDVVEAGRFETLANEARETYAEFETRARDAGAWADSAPLLAETAAFIPRLFTRAALEATSDERIGELQAASYAAFESHDPASRPYYLDRKLRWLTFAARATGGLKPAEMAEDGSFRSSGDALLGLERWVEPPAALASALAAHAATRLVPRAVFLGSAYDLVDASGYELSVAEALKARAVEVAVDLALRARIVALVAPDIASDASALADEAARFYDSDFLDAPAIGAWL
ncbi:MAG: YkgJ family cysteine cluster protein [Thermoplasmatota archaeon]